MRVLRIGLWSLLGLVVLLVAGVGIVLATFNPDRFKPEIIAAAQRATGRELTLQGPIHLGFSLQPTLTVEDVSLANPPGFSRPQMATLKALDLKLALWPLLSRRVEIIRLDLVQPDILLELNAKGQSNWQFTPAPGATPTHSGPATTTTPTGEKTSTQINVAELRIENGTVTWRDAASGQSAVIILKTLEVGAPSPAENMHLAMTAAYNGNPFTLSGDVGPLAQLHGAGTAAAWPVRLDIAAAGAKLALAGSIAQPDQMHGYAVKITANVPDLTALQPFVPHSALPPLHDIELTAQIADTGAALPAISDVTLHVGASDLGSVAAGLKIDKLDVTAPKADQPVHVAMQGSFGGAPATLNGSVGIPPLLMSGGKLGGTVPIDWTAQALGSSLVVKGTAGQGPDGRPMVNATATSEKLDGDALAAAIGQARQPAPPPPAGATPSAVSPSPPPPPTKGRLFPDTPIPFDLLRLADADVTLTIGELKWGGALYRAISTHLDLHGSNLKLDPVVATLPAGRLEGAFTADASQAAPPVTLRLNAPSLALQPVFAAVGKPEYVNGNIELHANLSGAGTTPHAIAASLNGTLGVAMQNATVDNRLLGSTLGSVLRDVNALDLVGRGGSSEIQCFAARLDARNGIATVQSLVLSSSLISMDGSGTINLGNETLDLHLRPQVRFVATPVVVPLRVTGSLRAPSTASDVSGAVAGTVGSAAGTALGLPLGIVSGVLSGGKTIGRSEGADCGAALAVARGGNPASTPAAEAAPAAPAGQPKLKLPNAGNLLKRLFP
jgi:AsmA protein